MDCNPLGRAHFPCYYLNMSIQLLCPILMYLALTAIGPGDSYPFIPEAICGELGSSKIDHYIFILHAHDFVSEGGDLKRTLACLECIARTSPNVYMRSPALSAMYQLGNGDKQTLRKMLSFIADPRAHQSVRNLACKLVALHFNPVSEQALIQLLENPPDEPTRIMIQNLLFSVASPAYADWLKLKAPDKRSREQYLIAIAQDPELILSNLECPLNEMNDEENSWLLLQAARLGVDRDKLRAMFLNQLEESNGRLDGKWLLLNRAIRLELFAAADYDRFPRLVRVQYSAERTKPDWITMPEQREREVHGLAGYCVSEFGR